MVLCTWSVCLNIVRSICLHGGVDIVVFALHIYTRWCRWSRVPHFITCMKIRSKVRMRARSFVRSSANVLNYSSLQLHTKHARVYKLIWGARKHVHSMLKPFIRYYGYNCGCYCCCCRHPGCCLSATAVNLCAFGWFSDNGNAKSNVQL